MAGRLSIASSLLLTSRVGLIGRMRLNVADKKSVNVRLKLYQYLVRVVSLKAWFIRISWYKKCDFVMDLVSITEDFSVLLKLMKNIDSGVFKDYSYLKSQDILEGFRDMIPADDNRTLEDVNVTDVQLQDRVWYAKLKPDQQYHVLNGLTTIGGCAFKRKIYEGIMKLIVDKQQFQSVINACLSVNYTVEQEIASTLSCDTGTPDEEWMKCFEQLKYYHLHACDINLTREGEAGEKRKDEMKGPTEIDLQKRHQLWRDEFQLLCTKYNVRMTPTCDAGLSQSKGARKQNVAAKKVPQKTTFDEIQMLPENINSRIFSYLGKDCMNVVKNVNPYWTFIVNSVTKEQDTAKKVNERISKLEQSKQPSPTSVSSERSSAELPELPEPPRRNGREEVMFLLKLFNRAARRLQLAGKPSVTPLNTQFVDGRAAACDRAGRVLALATRRRSVALCSLAAGGLRPLGPELAGHTGRVTCMCFTPCGRYLLTGSDDTTARCWDVNAQSELTIYAGHEESVTSISTDGNYVLTGGMDFLLKVFRRADGQCLTSQATLHPVRCVELNVKEDIFYCGHTNGYISIFSLSEKKLNMVVKAHTSSVNVLLMQYPILMSGGRDGVVRLWNSKEPKAQCLIEIKNSSEIHDICLAEYHIFIGDENGHVSGWNLITGQKEQDLTLGGVPSPILSIHSRKKTDSIQVIANAAPAVHSIEVQLWDVTRRRLFGPPHQKCCASFVEPSEKRREPFGLSSSAYKKIMLMKRCCVHKSLRDQEHKDEFYKSILAFVVNEVPSSFAMPAVSLKPFKRLVDLEDTTFLFDEMYRRHFPLVSLDSE